MNVNTFNNSKSLLSEIFAKNNYSLLNLIHNTMSIPKLMGNLLIMSETEQIAIIDELSFKFSSLRQNCAIFMKFKIDMKDKNLSPSNFKGNLYHILLSIYLASSSEADAYIYTSIRNLLQILVLNTDCNKDIFEYLYQKFSKFYRCDEFDKNLFDKYLILLKILYGEKKEENIYKPNNYFYFGGNGYMKVDGLDEEPINIDKGFLITMWFKIDLEEAKEKSNLCDLVNIKTNKAGKIDVELYINKIKINNFENTEIEVLNQWNHLTIFVKKGSYSSNPEIVLYLNQETPRRIPLYKFNFDSQITDIFFFKNFIGLSSTVAFIEYSKIVEDHIKRLHMLEDKNMKSFGLYSEKKLFKFLQFCHSQYMSNSNLTIENKVKDNEALKLLLGDMRFMYVPFRSSNGIIYDQVKKFHATIQGSETCGINIYNMLQKNIFFLGGINNLLPIVELMHSKDLICEKSLFAFFELLFTIFNFRLKNMKDAVNRNFFEMLSLFVEKFDKCIFTREMLDIFLKLGRILFTFVDKCELSTIYFESILLNEKIFTKFSIDLQKELWSSLYQFYVSDVSQIKNFMKMSKITLILRYYEVNRYKEYCCEEHALFFIDVEYKPKIVMSPTMKEKIEFLINIIQLKIDYSNNIEEAITLFKLLSLDLSPCLQKSIINVFTNFFANKKIPDEWKKKQLASFLKNSFINVILYMFSISLFDIRCECLTLLKELSNYKDILEKNYDYVIEYMKDHLMPDDLICYKSERPRISILSLSNLNANEDFNLSQNEFLKQTMSAKNTNKISFKFDADKIENFIKKEETDQFIGIKSLTMNLKLIDISDGEQSQQNDIERPANAGSLSYNKLKIEDTNDDESSSFTNNNKSKSCEFDPKNPFIKKNITGFSSRLRNNSVTKDFSIDTDNINKIYRFGGERHEMNISDEEETLQLENKIKVLAKHCVDYMNGIKTDCSKVGLVGTISKSVKGERKINYRLNSVDDIIEEESESPFLTRRSGKSLKLELNNMDNDTNFKQRLNFEDNPKLISPEKLPKDVDKLKKLLHPDKYTKYIDIIYNTLKEWLIFNKKVEREYMEGSERFTNPKVIDIIIKLSLKSDDSFIQKLTEELYLFTKNRFNSADLFNNTDFYSWLIEIAYKYFILSKNNDSNMNMSLSIYELAKKIHTDMLINSVISVNTDDKNKIYKYTISNKIDFLFSWGIFKKNKEDTNKQFSLDINSFINYLLKDIILQFKNILKTSSSNINHQPWEYFLGFSIQCYEYMVFFNLDKLFKSNMKISEMSMDRIIVPNYIFSGINVDTSHTVDNESISSLNTTAEKSKKRIFKINHIWTDYKLYEQIYEMYKNIWSKELYEICNKNTKDIIKRYEPLIDEYIKNKNKRDHFLGNLKLLNYKLGNTNISVMKFISNMFNITISLINDESELKFWIEEFEQFNIFIILASTNMTIVQQDFQATQEKVMEIVGFNICFLLDEFYNLKKNAEFMRYYIQTLKNIFAVIIIILDYANSQVNKKRNSNIFTNLINKNKKHDYSKCAIYRLFNEYFLDSTGIPLANAFKINELYNSRMIDIPEIFYNKEWRYGLTESAMLREKFSKVFDLPLYEVIIKERLAKMVNYIPIFNRQENLLRYELNKAMDKIIPQYDLEIKDYKNNVYLANKQRKIIYKCIKKKLFKWRGMWSDKEAFYFRTEKLKLKLMNHYASNMSRPLLIPILDTDHYIPNFSKFDKSQLFNSNEKNINYKINLNIEEILNKGQEEEITIGRSENSNTTSNFFYDIYKLNTYMWNIYEDINNCIDLSRSNGYHNLLSTIVSEKRYFVCCFVKLSHHIRGLFYLNTDGITFKVFLKSNSEDRRVHRTNSVQVQNKIDEDFDLDRGTCYGSYFIKHDKDFDHLSFNFPYNEIKYIFKRRYYYKKSAIEIFTTTNKSYYFNFKCSQDRDKILKGIMSKIESKREIKLDSKDKYKDKEDLIIGYENMFTKKNFKNEYLSTKIENWLNWRISNFEMLMWLNIYANRSFSDISQYPVFPWILKNYTDSLIEMDKDLREFDLPMGMMNIDEKGKGQERRMLYIESYKTLEAEYDSGLSTETPYIYGSHYSNPIYVSHYLTRIFPFSHIGIELQGDKFDDPNRLFLSIANSFNCATTQKGDVRELTPEFFYLPEIFINLNNLNLGTRTDNNMNKHVVDNVELPKWANYDPIEFIIKMKEYLESDDVSFLLSDWIDLIFGYKQKGEKGGQFYNLYIPSSYEDIVNLENIDKDQVPYYMRMVEFGLTPNQLTNKPFPNKSNKDYVRKGRQISESKELRAYGNFVTQIKKNKDGKEIKPLTMLKLKVLENEKVICVYNNNTFNICKFVQNDFKYNIDVYVSKVYNPGENAMKINSRMVVSKEANFPIIIYNSGKVIAQAGYWDGKICISNYEGSAKNYYYYTDGFPIVCLSIDKYEKYIYAGSSIGVLYVFEVNEANWKLTNTLYDHSKEITYIYISNTLNVIATSGLDGYVNLYTYPNNRLFRSIYLSGDVNITADYVFLSNSPLACCVIYSKVNNVFYCYNINGNVIYQEANETNHLLSPIVISDVSFNDFLIYGTESGEFRIRKFPYMKESHILSIKEIMKTDSPTIVKCIDITEDKKFAYLWIYDQQDITLIKDPNVTNEAATANLINMGFGF